MVCVLRRWASCAGPQLAQLENPALAGVMEHAVGQWGAILINGGVVLSLGGRHVGLHRAVQRVALRGG